MKNVLLIVILFCSTASAKTFYFSNSSGSDSRTAIQAQNPLTPWQTLDKLNEVFKTLLSGDSILLKRGDEFFGSINLVVSGSRGKPIVISAYGTGEAPLVTGFAKIENWTQLNKGIWESERLKNVPSDLSLILIDNEIQPIGRFPNVASGNKGYLIISAHSGKNNLTGSLPLISENMSGADIVVRSSQYTIDKAKILSQNGASFNIGPGLTYEPKEGYGFFIQNHPSTLDVAGEWYLETKKKKLQVFSGNKKPAAVKIALLDKLVTGNGISFIKIVNLQFSGANNNIIYVRGPGAGFEIQDCDVSNSGGNGIFFRTVRDIIIENCRVSKCLNQGISVTENSIVRNCDVNQTGYIAGMTENNAGMAAISNTGDGSTTELNRVKNSGYIGIRFGRSNNLIKNNVVDSFCLIKQDGGGIYAQGKKGEVYAGTAITGNIVLNGIGAPEGTNTANNNAVGIYCDDFMNNLNVTNNTASSCGVGIYFHNTQNIIATNNVSYNNSRVQLQISSDKNDYPVRDLRIQNNLFVSGNPKQVVSYFSAKQNDFESFGIIDDNIYARPGMETGNFFQKKIGKKMAANYTLETSRIAYPGLDKNSKKLPASIRDFSTLYFIYNPEAEKKIFSLKGNFLDVENNKYSGKLSLPGFSSLLLIRKS